MKTTQRKVGRILAMTLVMALLLSAMALVAPATLAAEETNDFEVTINGSDAFYACWTMGVDASHAGFSGTGFVAGFFSNCGAHITFTVEVPEAGEYDVTMGYAMGTNEAQGKPGKLGVYVNYTKQLDTTFEPGETWGTYLQKTEKLNLNAGQNTITYWYEDTSVVGAPNFDYIEIAGTKYEAEEAQFQAHGMGSQPDSPILEGYYTNSQAAAKYTISDVPKAGKYIVTINYANGNPEANSTAAALTVLVNDAYASNVELPHTENWGTYTEVSFQVELKEGTNTITLWKTGTEPQGANIASIKIAADNTKPDDGTELPPTGDTGVALAVALLVVSGMAMCVLKKGRATV